MVGAIFEEWFGRGHGSLCNFLDRPWVSNAKSRDERRDCEAREAILHEGIVSEWWKRVRVQQSTECNQVPEMGSVSGHGAATSPYQSQNTRPVSIHQAGGGVPSSMRGARRKRDHEERMLSDCNVDREPL